MSATKLKTGKSIDESIFFDEELEKYWKATKEQRKYIIPKHENNTFNIIVTRKYCGSRKTFDGAQIRRDESVSLIN